MAKSAFASELEFVALRLACAIVNVIPYRVAMGLASGLASFAVRVVGFKRKRTLSRIREVYPDIDRKRAMKIAVASLRNFLMIGVEVMRAPKLDRAWMDKYVVDGRHYKDILQSLVDEGNGVVIMVPHSGNWLMAAWSIAKYGLGIFAIGARQRNPKFNEWIKTHYGDIEVLDRDCRDTLVKIKRGLQAGRAFAIMPDLRSRKRDVEVDFLGGKANVSHAGAMFAVNCSSPIVVAQMMRKDGKHVFNLIGVVRPDPHPADKKAEALRLTREVMRMMDGEILKRPEDWFWYNKRWILEPPKD